MRGERAFARSVLVLALVAEGATVATAADLACPGGSVTRSLRSTLSNEDWCERAGAQGIRHGPFRMSSANGRLEGAYREGNRDGKWVGHYQDGSKSGEAEFQADVLEGPFRALYANGKTLAEGVFKNGRLSGPIVFFDPSGRRRLVMTVGADGSPKEQTAFDDTGKEVAPGTEFTRQNIGRSDFLDLVLKMGGIVPLY
jgi:hypothetical protein